MDGWIKLHRKIRDNPVFNDMNLFRLWMICLTEATHKERDQMVGKQIVKLLPGDFVTGRFDLAEMYNRGLKKKEQKPPTTIWRWLENLENNEFVVIKSNNKFSVVSVLKWLEYQSDGQQNGQQVVNKRSTDGQQVVTNNNVDNENNVKEEIKNIFSSWNSLSIVKHREMTKKMSSAINARLATRSEKEIIEAMTNYQTVLNGDLYWWTHKFTLDKFMDPKNLDQFLSENNPFENYRKSKGGGNGGKYQANYAGVSEESRKAASRGAEHFIGSPGRESGLTTEEVQRIASNFE
ncbi:hypothetical protein [Paenibacillus apii]|uniref:hypothetical protein n=1 Tax=Paenibacillus apii TaxID=1850370 RepID=UPI00143B1988|nr:hypothetical protein [Paenibacillus apii]NJJ38567.1 hypothetical protein [Paenibacillus apii]